MVQPAARFVSTILADSDDVATTYRDLHFSDLRKLPEGELAKLAEFMLYRIQGFFVGQSQDMLHVDHQQKVMHNPPFQCAHLWCRFCDTRHYLHCPAMIMSGKLQSSVHLSLRLQTWLYILH